MNEFQFMIFLQKLVRACANQRELSIEDRTHTLDAMNNYLRERLERDENPIYLHQVGDFLCMGAQGNYRSSKNSLTRVFGNKVQAIFSQDVKNMRTEYQEMSLYRLCQILRAMPGNQALS